jgi:SAM-dependent methyltransferase
MNFLHRWYCKTRHWQKTLNDGIIPWALKETELGDNILEIGSGPGLTTDILRRRYQRVTAIEIDEKLAASLKARLAQTNVRVITGDATKMPFDNESFTGVVSFTMMHHVPSYELQNQLLSEVYRVLIPGGLFVGTDSTWSPIFQMFHLFDTMVLVSPGTLSVRLEAAGFNNVKVDVGKGAFRFRAMRPQITG